MLKRSLNRGRRTGQRVNGVGAGRMGGVGSAVVAAWLSQHGGRWKQERVAGATLCGSVLFGRERDFAIRRPMVELQNDGWMEACFLLRRIAGNS